MRCIYFFSEAYRWASLVSSPGISKLRLGRSLLTASPVLRMGISTAKTGDADQILVYLWRFGIMSSCYKFFLGPNVQVFGLLFNFLYSSSHFLLKPQFLIKNNWNIHMKNNHWKAINKHYHINFTVIIKPQYKQKYNNIHI